MIHGNQVYDAKKSTLGKYGEMQDRRSGYQKVDDGTNTLVEIGTILINFVE